uniref:HAT C-terminal dimerisation domain-containing protein n=1 Tax=Panagrolaimus sp. ES5 TaxID=591445 RepID=A0AC34GDY7_9BILA
MRPSTLKDTLLLFDSTLSMIYPNIKTLLIILATLPVTTVIVEKSFSTLRHIFGDFRACMNVERVSDLALLSWHDKMTHELETKEVIEVFNQKGRRF